MIKYIALLLATNLSLILIILFVSWGSSPAEWESVDRAMVALLVTVANVLVIGFREMMKGI